MKYCIVMEGRRSEFIEGRNKAIERLDSLAGETVVDIRKVYKDGATASVADTPAWCGYIGKGGAE